MIALFAAVSLPYLRAHAGRLLLTLLGVIIGVQGMVAMGALNHSIVRSFEAGVDAIAGTAKLQVAGPDTGIPEAIVADVQGVPGVAHAIPMIQGALETTGDSPERIVAFGVDLLEAVGARNPQFPREHVHIADELGFLNALDSVALGRPLLERLGVKVGDRIDLVTPAGVQAFTVRGVLDDVGPMKLYQGAVALLDLPTAQRVLLAPDLVQTIYVTAKPGIDTDALRSQIQAAIGQRARVERTTSRGQQVEALLGSLRVALSLANLVTMIVAFFIIFQTVAIAVEQRQREIAIARSLGFTRRAVSALFLAECGILGMIGALGGVVGGWLLARVSLEAATAGVSQMYQHVAVSELHLPFLETVVAAGFGIATCVLAGILPAREAAGRPPAQVLRASFGVRTERSDRHLLAMGLGVLAAAVVALSLCPRFDTSRAKVAWTMLGHTLLIFGTALVAPAFVSVWARLASRLGARGSLPTGLATEFFARRPRRAAATISAIMVGYLLVLVLGSVACSIERTLAQWLATIFAADLMVSLPPGLDSGTFDESLAMRLEQLPGVDRIERHRKGMMRYEDAPIVLVTFDRAGRPDGKPLVIMKANDRAYDTAEAGQGVFISDSFVFRFGHQIGDQIELDTAEGRQSFEVVGIIQDYALDLGTVATDLTVFRRLWKDLSLTSANVWRTPNSDSAALRERIIDIAHSDPRVSIVTNEEFRANVQHTINDLLRILGSLRLFACAIAMLGVITFLLAAVVDRRRELSVLRSIGVTRSQIRQAVMIEAGMLGFVGACLGLLAGFVASYYMVTHSIRVDMGWTLDFSFPVGLALSTLLAITIAAAVAGYIPARQFTRGSVLAGLQTE